MGGLEAYFLLAVRPTGLVSLGTLFAFGPRGKRKFLVPSVALELDLRLCISQWEQKLYLGDTTIPPYESL